MFDSHFRTLFLSTPAKLSHKNANLIITKEDTQPISIPLSDILCLILESHQITLSTSLLDILSKHKVLVFVCNSSHLPSGIFSPFLGHYQSLKILHMQLSISKQKKAVLWQRIVKQKLNNQSSLLCYINKSIESSAIAKLAKCVTLGDSNNNEAQGAAMYFPALFGKNFKRRLDYVSWGENEINAINSSLNYGYAIVRGMVVRSICSSGLSPVFGVFHSNTLNAFNLADDLIEPYRIFVDFLTFSMLNDGTLTEELQLSNRIRLAEILQSSVKLVPSGKFYPLYRAIIVSVQSFVKSMTGEAILELPSFEENSNGREIYESASDV